jgi:ATP-dependent RNA helicase DeaD
LTIEDRVTTEQDARAALERGRPVIVVAPPAPEQAQALWEIMGPPVRGAVGAPPVLIVCADDTTAAQWASAAPADRRVHVVTGLRRAARCLRSEPIDVLAGTVSDLSALVGRSALKLDAVSTIVVAWPELLVAGEHAEVLETLLGGAPAARRIVLCWNPARLSDFLERHARRGEQVGGPIAIAGIALPPLAPARYVVAAPSHRPAVVQAALEQLDPERPLFWDGGPVDPSAAPDAVLCLRLPTRDELATLARTCEPIVFVTGAQLPYLRSIATAVTPLRLPAAADQAHGRAAAIRARIARLLETRHPDGELAILDPLFAQFDPAEVAAALLAILGEEGRGRGEEGAPAAARISGAPVRVFVNVGKKDRASAKDLVGALIKEVGIAKTDIGRIDVRDTFTTVDVAPAVAERVVRDLTGVTIRGRRAMARLDRYS